MKPIRSLPPFSFSSSYAGLLIRQGKIRFRIVSNSMSPCLRAGDLVKLAPAEPEDLKAGEIIVTSRGETLLGHRLVRYFEREGTRWVITKGECAAKEDPPVPAERVVGRIIGICRPRIFHRLAWRARRKAGQFLRNLPQGPRCIPSRMPRR